MTSVETSRNPVREEAAEGALPRHVAIVMDGNRRWARLHDLPEAQGHAAGVEAIRPIVSRAVERGIQVLSIYAFSRENWARDSAEVETLMTLLESAIRDETPELARQGVRVQLLGRMAELAPQTRLSIEQALSETATGTRMTLNVAFNYSGRTEIVDAVQDALSSGVPPDQIDEQQIAGRLYGDHLPELDLLIRTGGEQRISNFLLWQSAYAELYFTDRLWPDFDPDAFDAALSEYARRSRRFGR